MKKLLITLFILLLLVILGISGILFSQMGNDTLKPYLKSKLEKEIGLPVEISHFKLRYDHTELNIIVNHALNVEFQSDFILLNQSFKGLYQISANNFIYNKIKLRKANIYGDFEGDSKDIFVDGKGNLLDAPLDYKIHLIDNNPQGLSLTIKEAELSELLALSSKPIFAKGKISSTIKINNFNTLDGTFTIDSKKLITQPLVMKKLMGKALNVNIALNSKGDITKGIAHINTKIKTSMGDIDLIKTTFDMHKNILTSNYKIDILDLKKLHPLIQQKLYGKMLLNGDISKSKTLKIKGDTQSLGGDINYKIFGDNLSAKISKVSVGKILNIFGYSKIIEGKASGDITHNSKVKRGKVKVVIDNFKIAPNTITKTLTKILKKDPSRIIFQNTTLTANIKGNDMFYKLIAKGRHASIEITNAQINQIKNIHNATIKFTYESYSIKITISGSIKNPKISLDTSSIITDKVKSEFKDRAKKELNKVLDGKVGDFFKGLGF